MKKTCLARSVVLAASSTLICTDKERLVGTNVLSRRCHSLLVWQREAGMHTQSKSQSADEQNLMQPLSMTETGEKQ